MSCRRSKRIFIPAAILAIILVASIPAFYAYGGEEPVLPPDNKPVIIDSVFNPDTEAALEDLISEKNEEDIDLGLSPEPDIIFDEDNRPLKMTLESGEVVKYYYESDGTTRLCSGNVEMELSESKAKGILYSTRDAQEKISISGTTKDPIPQDNSSLIAYGKNAAAVGKTLEDLYEKGKELKKAYTAKIERYINKSGKGKDKSYTASTDLGIKAYEREFKRKMDAEVNRCAEKIFRFLGNSKLSSVRFRTREGEDIVDMLISIPEKR